MTDAVYQNYVSNLSHVVVPLRGTIAFALRLGYAFRVAVVAGISESNRPSEEKAPASGEASDVVEEETKPKA